MTSSLIFPPLASYPPSFKQPPCTPFDLMARSSVMVNHLQTFQVSGKLLRFAMVCSGILPSNLQRVVYLDADLAVVDDTWKLWCVGMEEKVVAAPEYCHANFTQYFTGRFWSDTELARTFQGRNPCYFNTGVLAGDKFEGKCRNLHPGPIRLLHWSGKGKPG